MGQKSETRETLETLRAINELQQGLREIAPLFVQVLGLMRATCSGENPMGYFEAADKIDKATVDEKDAMLLMGTQWIAQVLEAARNDQDLKATLLHIFPHSTLIQEL